ncbi:hypothetical protein [Haliangium sp.]
MCAKRWMNIVRVGLLVTVSTAGVLPSWAQPGPERDSAPSPRDGAPRDGRISDDRREEPDPGEHELDGGVAADPNAPWYRGVSRETQAEALALLQEGNRLYADALFAPAAAQFQRALARWDHPAFHYNLALARIQLDQPIQAHASMAAALRYGAAPLGRDHYEHARGYLRLLRNQLAEIEVTCADPGARVTLDGDPLFVAPGRYRGLVQPGSHQLVVSKDGHIPATEGLVLGPGDSRRVALALPVLTMVEKRRWPTWRPWAVAGAGVALVAAGGVLHWRADQDAGAFEAAFQGLACADGRPTATGCDEIDLPSGVDTTRRRATWERRGALVAYGIGGAAVAAGAVLAYLNRARTVRELRTPGPDPSAGRLHIEPLAGPGSAGLRVGIRF